MVWAEGDGGGVGAVDKKGASLAAAAVEAVEAVATEVLPASILMWALVQALGDSANRRCGWGSGRGTRGGARGTNRRTSALLLLSHRVRPVCGVTERRRRGRGRGRKAGAVAAAVTGEKRTG